LLARQAFSKIRYVTMRIPIAELGTKAEATLDQDQGLEARGQGRWRLADGHPGGPTAMGGLYRSLSW